ncbi:MAG: hypothetical protein R3B06_22115 [Kofleriaceae bacterium]
MTGTPEPASTSPTRLAVDLVSARGQHLRWVLIGLVIGGLCVYGLGTLGKVVGVGLVALGGWNAWLLGRGLRNPTGTIVVDDARVELPRGPARGRAVTVARADVSAVYFLRRAVPWTQAAPVLVIEAAGRAYTFPRDWFASEIDQRRILDELTPS